MSSAKNEVFGKIVASGPGCGNPGGKSRPSRAYSRTLRSRRHGCRGNHFHRAGRKRSDRASRETILSQDPAGAGTVLDPETARIAILAGAQFVVGSALNPGTARLCNRYQVPYMPGAGTIREVIEAMECGADIIKVFPGEVLGPAFVKAAKGPLPQAQLMPTGGVSLESVAAWINAGAVAVGVAGNLTTGAKTSDFSSITKLARQFAEKIRQPRGQ